MIWDELGNIYMMVPDYENAIRAFDLRLSISKQNAEDTLLNKAECLSITGKNGEALKIYNTILETDKENADAAFGIAKCYEREGMCNIAEKLYLDIIRENSDYTDAYYCLANIYAQQNNFEAAERFMLKVLDNAEVTPAFLIQMTEILLQQNKLAEAKKIMEKVITKPSYKHDYIAWLLYSEIIAEYDVVKAIEILEEKYNESFYSIAEVCYHLAYYHFSNNNITQCIVYFERGLELNDKLIKPFFDLCPEVKLNTQIMNVYLSFMAKHL
jgi:tetratricopeptide (TPR) repeat protein